MLDLHLSYDQFPNQSQHSSVCQHYQPINLKGKCQCCVYSLFPLPPGERAKISHWKGLEAAVQVLSDAKNQHTVYTFHKKSSVRPALCVEAMLWLSMDCSSIFLLKLSLYPPPEADMSCGHTPASLLWAIIVSQQNYTSSLLNDTTFIILSQHLRHFNYCSTARLWLQAGNGKTWCNQVKVHTSQKVWHLCDCLFEDWWYTGLLMLSLLRGLTFRQHMAAMSGLHWLPDKKKEKKKWGNSEDQFFPQQSLSPEPKLSTSISHLHHDNRHTTRYKVMLPLIMFHQRRARALHMPWW